MTKYYVNADASPLPDHNMYGLLVDAPTADQIAPMFAAARALAYTSLNALQPGDTLRITPLASIMKATVTPVLTFPLGVYAALPALLLAFMLPLVAAGCAVESLPPEVAVRIDAVTGPAWPGCYLNDLTQPIAGNWDVKGIASGYAAVRANAPANGYSVGQQNQWWIAWPLVGGYPAFATAATIGSNPQVSSCVNGSRTITWTTYSCPPANLSMCGNPSVNGLQGYTGTQQKTRYQGSCANFDRLANAPVCSWANVATSKQYGATPETYGGATCQGCQ